MAAVAHRLVTPVATAVATAVVMSCLRFRGIGAAPALGRGRLCRGRARWGWLHGTVAVQGGAAGGTHVT
ncbi:hypothetical protein GCM10010284_47250 [Streptomyces rubiginosohelvolus]|uniref:Secreted protein n=1 Tax=Streptomyces rubiginosohelvolus TaxID=67362 RepID=A0ABQ3BZC4_9ACTN|nr:hypothetical protein GCM10010284_47250 [Streptomyces rubiginosohelvolus]GGZ62315.1 hypothetical protein GCM10010328_41210 [Streptomyces pluricolorescens]